MAFQIAGRNFEDATQLEKLVIHAATQYESEGYAEDFDGIEITDPQYDDLYRKLREVKPRSKAFKGTSPSENKQAGKTVILDPPLTSIEKADGDDKKAILEKWLNTFKGKVSLSEKRDGVCARAQYEDGKLKYLALRPRGGVNGTDITRHVKYIKGIPMELPKAVTLGLNMEIECHMSDFLKVNEAREEAGEDLYKNPRNYTAGCLGRDDAEENSGSCLQATIHGIVGFEDATYTTEVEKRAYATETLGLKNYIQILTKNHDDLAGIYKALERFENAVPKLNYYVDGVVCKADNLEEQEALGHHGDDPIKPPRGALAWKFAEEVAVAVVKELIWEGSRTGRIVPVAVFEKPIDLADTAVSRATCNNFGWALTMGIGPGTKVQVIKAGKIIPKVIGVLEGAISEAEFKKLAPKRCPVYGNELKIVTNEDSGNQDLMCLDDDYPPKRFKAWLFYVQSVGGKGLGPSAMQKILDGGKVKSLADLYELTVQDLLDSGFTPRQALLALATIHMVPPKRDDDVLLMDIMSAKLKKKILPAWQFFGALGIPNAGRTAGKALIQKYRSMEAIMDAKDLEKVDGIGEKTAESIYDYFSKNRTIIKQLLDKHIELELPKTGSLTGKSFCLTGKFDDGKKHWEEAIAEKGGTINSSVGKTTTYLVMQHGKTDGSPSAKEKKAAQYGTEVISVSDLKELLQ
jgi:DNA ligase (NAD+)